MATNAGISRSGRVRKKSAKLIEMEDWDATDPESFGKVRKKLPKSPTDESEGDKKVAPIKIPKLSLGISSPSKKKEAGASHSLIRVPFPNAHGRSLSSLEEKSHISEAQSMSSSLESSESSSSDDSDMEHLCIASDVFTSESKKKTEAQEHIRSQHTSRSDLFKSLHGTDGSSEPAGSFDDSEEDTNESPLIIAETTKKQTVNKKIKRESKPKLKKTKKPKPSDELSDLSPSTTPEKKLKKKKPPEKGGKAKGKKKDKSSSRPMTAYMLWCQENRKKIVAQSPVMDFVSISKKLGEIWQSLSEKEKMAWRKKAKGKDTKNSPLINTGQVYDQSGKHSTHSSPSSLKISDDSSKSGSLDGFKTVGTSPIDVAAHLKLLGESLSIIGQRLTEHEGQIAVSGSLSVLLDSTLCALAPLLCLTSQVKELDGCSQDNLSHILDNIAYVMPGL